MPADPHPTVRTHAAPDVAPTPQVARGSRKPTPPLEYLVVANLTNGTHLVMGGRCTTAREAQVRAASLRRTVAGFRSLPIFSVDVWQVRAQVLRRPAPAVTFAGIE